jgi:AcrR family transcriptional regulator
VRMPRLIDTDDRAGVLVAAVNHVLVMEGPAGLSLRRIAAVSGVSTSSMLHHLGSREHLLRVAAGQTAKARRWDVESRAYTEGATAFLPFTSDQVLDARAWLAWLELWRSEESLDAMLSGLVATNARCSPACSTSSSPRTPSTRPAR